MRIAIVTASDEGYFGTLKFLLQSLEGIGRLGDFSIHVLDIGLTDAQRREVGESGCALIEPGWDVDVSHLQGVPGWFRAMTARPFLPDYIQACDLIFWIDADVWVQDQVMLHDFVLAAGSGNLAVCLELDRSYDNVFLRNASKDVYYNNLARGYGDEIAARLIHLPMMNVGVFALARGSRIWRVWQDTAKSAVKRYCSNFLEQTALNVAVYMNDIRPHFLPARYNWMACHATPAFDESGGIFVEPNLPHDRLGLVHLACGLWKKDDIEYRTTDGAVRRGPLRPRQASGAAEGAGNLPRPASASPTAAGRLPDPSRQP